MGGKRRRIGGDRVGDSSFEDWERGKKLEGPRTRLASLGMKNDGTLNTPDAGN